MKGRECFKVLVWVGWWYY